MLPRCHWSQGFFYTIKYDPKKIDINQYTIHTYTLTSAHVRNLAINLWTLSFRKPLNLRRLYARQFITRSFDLIIPVKGRDFPCTRSVCPLFNARIGRANVLHDTACKRHGPHQNAHIIDLLMLWISLQAWILIWSCLEIFMASSNCFNVSKAMGA